MSYVDVVIVTVIVMVDIERNHGNVAQIAIGLLAGTTLSLAGFFLSDFYATQSRLNASERAMLAEITSIKTDIEQTVLRTKENTDRYEELRKQVEQLQLTGVQILTRISGIIRVLENTKGINTDSLFKGGNDG